MTSNGGPSFPGFLQPGDASPGYATPSSGSSSPEVFFDATDHLPLAVLTPTPALTPGRRVEAFHDASETAPVGVNVYIDDSRSTDVHSHGQDNVLPPSKDITAHDPETSKTFSRNTNFITFDNRQYTIPNVLANYTENEENEAVLHENQPRSNNSNMTNDSRIFSSQSVFMGHDAKNSVCGEYKDGYENGNYMHNSIYKQHNESVTKTESGKGETGEADSVVTANAEKQKRVEQQRPRGQRFRTEFLPPREQQGSTLREETRKIVQMLANDKTCKINRPSLGLQDRLQSLAQRSAGKRTSYVKGPRVCSTLVKSIVRRTQESLNLRRNSFLGINDMDTPPPPTIVPNFARVGKSDKKFERRDTSLGSIQGDNSNNFELKIKIWKGTNIASIVSGPRASSPPRALPPQKVVHEDNFKITHEIIAPETTVISYNKDEVANTSSYDTVSTIEHIDDERICDYNQMSVQHSSQDPSPQEVLDTSEPSSNVIETMNVLQIFDNPLPVARYSDGHGVNEDTGAIEQNETKITPQSLQKDTTALVSRSIDGITQEMESSRALTAKEKPEITAISSPTPLRQKAAGHSNEAVDLRKHIASLNKVSHKLLIKKTEPVKAETNVTLERDVEETAVNKSTFHHSGANGGDLQDTVEHGLERSEKSPSPVNEVSFFNATRMERLKPDVADTVSDSEPLHESPNHSSVDLQDGEGAVTSELQEVTAHSLMFPEEGAQPASSASRQPLFPVDALNRLKTDNLVARHRGTKLHLHPYPAPLLPGLRKYSSEAQISNPSKGSVASGEQVDDAATDSPPARLPDSRHDSVELPCTESLPPVPPSGQGKNKRPSMSSWSRQGSREEVSPARGHQLLSSASQASFPAERRRSKAGSRKGSLGRVCGGGRRGSGVSRRNSHALLHSGSGSRRGSRVSFSQDALRKCLKAAVDRCYDAQWEETCDSDIVQESNLSQEDLNKSLSKAVCRHDAEKVRVLLKLGADPNVRCGHLPALLRAAKEGALYVTQALLAAGADVDVRSELGNSPLHVAARGGYSEVAIQLVHSGAFVDAINRSGVTPLQVALAHGHLEVARSLLRLDADMFLQNKVGESAYEVANQLGYIELSGAPREVRRDSGPGTRVKAPCTSIPVAVRLIRGIEEGCAGTVDDCLREGAAPDTVLPLALHWPARATVLHRAAHHGQDLIVRLLLAAGADIHRQDVMGNSPLHVAAQAGYNRVIKILLDHGAGLETPTQSGMTPLHRAASKGKELTCNLLLRRGGCPFKEDNAGRTPADWARKRGFKQLSKKLSYRRKSSGSLLDEGDSKLCLQHLHRLHEAALQAPFRRTDSEE